MGDAAAALIHDGEVIAAVEEERFSRVKHHSGFPYRAVEYCLAQAQITMAEVDYVSHYWKPWVIRHKALETARSLTVSRKMFKARVGRSLPDAGSGYLEMLSSPAILRKHFERSNFRFRFLDHHACHAASTFLVSPFDSAAILTIDGAGEATTTMLAVGRNTRIDTLKRTKLPHSLGQFYSAITNFLGFDMMAGDEWKVMGLAAYGKPEHYDFMTERVLSMTGSDSFRFNVGVLDHHMAKQYQFTEEVIRELGPARSPNSEITERHQNIAASAQLILEDIVLNLVEELHRRTGETNLCLAGGVAFNSVMNGRIIRESPFERVFIQPVAGDAGCSLGAAYLTYHGELNNPRCYEMQHVYFGPSFETKECSQALGAANLPYESHEDDVLLPRIARLIADGAIVGWFQGRAEFGPRALGNRSFLADPRRSDMRDLLNQKVKLREWFRPLAPSVLEEASDTYFGRPYSDPYMVTVLDVSAEQRDRIPAVVHVDGSARPQTVSRKTNPRFWRLISEFEAITGVPMLLNTSFNVQEPIVCTPEDAVRTFQRSNFDALVLENHLALRPEASRNSQ